MDAVFERHGDICLATMTAEGCDVVTAARAAIDTLQAEGFDVLRSYPDLVNRGEIAERLEVTRQAVGNWIRGQRQSEAPFPAPAHLAAGGLWLWGDISRWVGEGIGDASGSDLAYPTTEAHLAIDACLHDRKNGAFIRERAEQPTWLEGQHHARQVSMRLVTFRVAARQTAVSAASETIVDLARYRSQKVAADSRNLGDEYTVRLRHEPGANARHG